MEEILSKPSLVVEGERQNKVELTKNSKGELQWVIRQDNAESVKREYDRLVELFPGAALR